MVDKSPPAYAQPTQLTGGEHFRIDSGHLAGQPTGRDHQAVDPPSSACQQRPDHVAANLRWDEDFDKYAREDDAKGYPRNDAPMLTEPLLLQPAYLSSRPGSCAPIT